MSPYFRISRSRLALIHDTLVATLAFFVALVLSGAYEPLRAEPARLISAAALFVLTCVVSFRTFGLYRGVWRYASMRDLLAIGAAVTAAILFYLPMMALVQPLHIVPWALPHVAWYVLVVFLGAPRFVYRGWKDRRMRAPAQAAPHRVEKVLLVGAGDEAESFIRAVASDPRPTYRIIGLLDEKEHRVGLLIHGLPVLGGIDDMETVTERLARRGKGPERLILTKGRDRIHGEMVRRLVSRAESLGLSVSRMPLEPGEVPRVGRGLLNLRPIEIDDLLGRPQADFDRTAVDSLLQGRRVLVTGAGGTIGSELCRQIAQLEPARLVIVDHSEFNLYSIDLALRESHPGLDTVGAILDVRDRDSLFRLFETERPELVFHAAALKHVPIVEANPCQGVQTNVIGSRNVADACLAAEVQAMVLISTDKAVNPSNVMGATKRIAERYCQALDVATPQGGVAAAARRTRYMTVRFGNVLGSTGSVVPLFQRQIARGGPVTVTHPDVERYFMTVPEAVELVLQASAHGGSSEAQRGKIMVLDMGRPVRIVDLATQMIKLNGLEPERDIRIEFSGLRPGEKLTEELFSQAEPLTPSPVHGVMIASPRPTDRMILARSLSELSAAAQRGDDERVRDLIRHLVPEWATETETLPDRLGPDLPRDEAAPDRP